MSVESTATETPKAPEQAVETIPATPKQPVTASLIALRLLRHANRMIGTFAAALAAFMILLAGILTLFEAHQPSLNGVVPVFADFGLFLFGIFFMCYVNMRLVSVYAPRAKKKTTRAPPSIPVG